MLAGHSTTSSAEQTQRVKKRLRKLSKHHLIHIPRIREAWDILHHIINPVLDQILLWMQKKMSIFWPFLQQLSHHKPDRFGQITWFDESFMSWVTHWSLILRGFQNGINELKVVNIFTCFPSLRRDRKRPMLVVWHQSWFLTECGWFWSS